MLVEKNDNIYAALIHYPVYNKRKEIIATSITTLDIHDLARITKTYGLGEIFFVTPLEAQKRLVKRILDHWNDGHGGKYNPNRKEAFEMLSVVESIEEVKKKIQSDNEVPVKVIVTCARKIDGRKEFSEIKSILSKKDNKYLVLFGTGWGLTEDIIKEADYVLEPIDGGTEYNHLPVRGAFAIIIDRLLGR